MASPVKLGIIGCGVIGSKHVEQASACPDVELVAVADLIEERAAKAAEKHHVPKRYSSDVELLKDDEIEAVVLAMPVFDRTPAAFRALEKRKHILIEKPIAGNVKDVEKMIAMRGYRVVSCCSSRNTFSGHAAAAAKCVADGVLGQIRYVRFRNVLGAPAIPAASPPPWRQSMKLNGGGILVNWSCYDLDYVMYITGWRLEPQVVLAQWWRVGEKMTAYVAPDSDADSHFTALIQCQDGIALSMERAEFAAAKNELTWEIIGTEASLRLPMVPFPGLLDKVILERFVPGHGVVTETLWDKDSGGPDETLHGNFARAIREGIEPRTSLERSLTMQKLTDAIYASGNTGEAVRIGN